MRFRILLVLLLSLALLPAMPAAAGGGCHGEFRDARTAEITTERMCFSPTVARVEPGTTVTWRNTDGMQHNVWSQAGFGGDLGNQATYSHRFTEPGVYPYVCTFHPGMVGAVVVGDGIPATAGLTGTTEGAAGASEARAAAPAEAVATAAAATTGTGLAAWVIAGALALLAGLLLLSSGRIRRQRPEGSAAS